jgi:predicted secreted hydrolase
VAGLNLTLLVTTPLPSQELATSSSFVPSYWEGAILLQGKKNTAAVTGSGYLEMTGYDRPVSGGGF